MKFTSILKNLIVESAKMQVMSDKYLKPRKSKEDGKRIAPLLTKDEFLKLIQADPDTKMNNVDPQTATDEELMKIKPGKYSEWIIKHYLKPEIFEDEMNVAPDSPQFKRLIDRKKEMYIGEDLDKITEDLRKFMRFSGRIQGERDLGKLSPSQLYNAVKDFSLEKTKASAEEKKLAQETYEHPGGEVIFRGDKWTVVKIADPGPLGKDAACFYGGHYLTPSKGETRWCTSSPGLSYFNTYIKDGPLYVVIPNNFEGNRGEKSNLPATRYQFHFPSDQFMDVHDHRINLIDFLNGDAKEIKGLFKKEFAKGLTIKGEELKIDSFTSGAVGKYVALYGLDDIFDTLPDNLTTISIYNKDQNSIEISLPESISRFKNLGTLVMRNCLKSLPNSICELKQLNFITLIDNKELREIPACIATELPNLVFVNLQGSMNVQIPPVFNERGKQWGDRIWDFETEEED